MVDLIPVETGLLGSNIRYLRRRKHLSQFQFAKMVGLSETMVFCIERGLFRGILKEPMLTICRLYGITQEELFYEDLPVKLKRKRLKPTATE